MTHESPVLISACLLGEACRFDGQGKENPGLLDRLKDRTLIPVCPEVEGGLSVPRPPAEIVGESVQRATGEDVTQAFVRGSELCKSHGLNNGTSLAILKSRSPACGCGEIYDGTFSKTLITGDGIFTKTLKSAGIECVSDEEFLENISR